MKKRIISVILTVVLLLSALSALTAFTSYELYAGEEDSDDAGSATPGDAWDGDYTEFNGSDGSLTRVFDNGSVQTEYADGSKTGVDYKGNLHEKNKNGDYTVRTTDGYTATEYADGRTSLTEPDGKTTTINPDQSFTESYASLGISVDYHATGALKGVGFTGSDERIGVNDEYEFKNGEISGPNGATLKISDDGVHIVTPGGTVADYSESGNEDTQNGNVETFSIKTKDGTHAHWEVNTRVIRTADGDFDGKEISKSGGVDFPDGAKYEYADAMKTDANGDPAVSVSDVAQFTGADGKTLWIDNNSKALEYRDPENGDLITFDKNGSLTAYKGEGNDISVIYDDGNVKSAEIKYKDGARMTQNPDGSGSFTLPDGTKYETDGNGNVYKDGTQIKKDGEWIPDENPDPEQTDPDDTDPDDTDPDEPDRPGDPSFGLSLSRIVGTYSSSGYDGWEDFEDPKYNGTESFSETLVFRSSGSNTLILEHPVEEFSYSATYDPSTGKCTFYVSDDEGTIALNFVFSESGGEIRFTASYSKTYEDGRMYGKWSGTKN